MSEMWWERRRDGEPTATYLGRVLDEVPVGDMAKRAREGHFDDYFAPAEVADGMEILRLVNELEVYANTPATPRNERPRIRAVIAAVKEGEFDGTREESARWQQSADGQRAMAQLPPEVRRTMFGEDA
jgi:hypothetical protein